MGYETTLFFVEKSEKFGKEKKSFCSIIAQINMCKIGGREELGLVMPLKPEVYIYFFSNNRIIKDCYGEPLSIGDPKIVLEKLVALNKKEKYRRAEAAIALLRQLIKGKYHNLTVLGYGH